MSWSRIDGRARAGALALATLLGGCSDIYFDRRETIVPTAGDAMASNRVVHMVDPWPPASANRNIAFNGEVMQSAVERYRQGRVIPPVNATTSSAAYARASASAASAAQQVRSSTSSSSPSSQSASSQPSGWAGSSQSGSSAQSQSISSSQAVVSTPPGETR
jgi:hypothetical protein